MTHTLRVGLTGGIGSGKTTACELFRELGVPIIDADHIAHHLIDKDGAAYSIIKNEFGNKIIMDNGQIDRSLLRKIIFSRQEYRKKLEAILHPLIFSEIEKQVSSLVDPYCIICIPLLVETNALNKVDRVLVIDSDKSKQIERTQKRDNITKKDVIKIIEAQASPRQRLNAADDVIHNNDDIVALRKEILLLHEKYNYIAKNRRNYSEISQ